MLQIFIQINSRLLCIDNLFLIGHKSSGFDEQHIIVLSLEAPSPLQTHFLKVCQLLQVIDAECVKKVDKSFSQVGWDFFSTNCSRICCLYVCRGVRGLPNSQLEITTDFFFFFDILKANFVFDWALS